MVKGNQNSPVSPTLKEALEKHVGTASRQVTFRVEGMVAFGVSKV